MGSYQLAQLIRNHEGNPLIWTGEIFEHDDNNCFGQKEIDDITQAIEMSSVYDRSQTANRLTISLRQHMNNIHALGNRATPYEIYVHDVGRELLVWLIQIITP